MAKIQMNIFFTYLLFAVSPTTTLVLAQIGGDTPCFPHSTSTRYSIFSESTTPALCDNFEARTHKRYFEGEFFCSPDSEYQMGITLDGDLCICSASGATWCAGICCAGEGSYMVFQGDGHFVVYNPTQSNRVSWKSDTGRNPGSTMVLTNDGVAMIKNNVGEIIWSVRATDKPAFALSNAPSLSIGAEEPSIEVSNEPSSISSVSPTTEHTEEPSIKVSNEPSSISSVSPTTEHTKEPSIEVSNEPSSISSVSPTNNPSDLSTNMPTFIPTTTSDPTNELSTIPTADPTDSPAPSKSFIPTVRPSESESAPPSEIIRPNMIVMQPDDFPFFAEWTPPPKNPLDFMGGSGNRAFFAESFPNNYSMPNLEMLRTQGLQMMQAYTASAMCATSRFSTITGRYPSRSGVNRRENFNETVSGVSVGNTKLHDVDGQAKDCTEDNIAAVLKSHGYRTGMVGKWHLSDGLNVTTYTYENAQEEIENCGFDYVDGLYVENLNFFQNVSHNHEWVTSKAIEFIKNTADKDENNQTDPFFLYFNPTVPHPSGDVAAALRNFTCRQTTNGLLEEEPVVPKMTADYPNCTAYRDSIFERAGNSTTAHDLGSIWIDDSVGALIHTLEEIGELENTIFLFQLDHGVEAKNTHWENGNRIAQFIHYPNEFGTNGLKMTLPVSTIDVTPTFLDFANVDANDLYEMDGKSWRHAYKEESGLDVDDFSSRCLLSELRTSRALVCNKCDKLMKLNELGQTTTLANGFGFADESDEMYFSLCSEEGKYINYPDNSTEANNLAYETWDTFMTMKDVLDCMLEKTSPTNPPDFSLDECSFSNVNIEYDGITAPPALKPTANPTMAPTVSHSPSLSISPSYDPLNATCEDTTESFVATTGKSQGQMKSCKWVAGKKKNSGKGGPGSKRCDEHGKDCPVTCELC